MLKIGVTGGIGSGKSLVCKIFASLGYKIYEADHRAKWLMNHQPELIEAIRDLFGDKAYLDDGTLDRAYIGGIVFNDQTQLARLNSIVHPATGKDFDQWVEQIPPSYQKPFVLKEAAILFESGAYRQSDAVITVYAPKKLRIERVVNRDNTTVEAVLNRMDKQWPEWKKNQLADFTIINDGLHPLTSQIVSAIQFFTPA